MHLQRLQHRASPLRSCAPLFLRYFCSPSHSSQTTTTSSTTNSTPPSPPPASHFNAYAPGKANYNPPSPYQPNEENGLIFPFISGKVTPAKLLKAAKKMHYADEGDSREWLLSCVVSIERYPTLEPLLPEWRIKYDKWKAEFDAKTSQGMNWDDKLVHKQGERERLPEGYKGLDDFVPAPRETEDDKADNRRSINRALDKTLYLLLKRRNPGPDGLLWELPGGDFDPEKGLTLKQTARSFTRSYCGQNFNLWWIGNSPAGHFREKLVESEQKKTGMYGRKLFHYRTQFMGGGFKINKEVHKDFAWVTLEQMKEYFPEEYAHFLECLLHHE